MRNTSLKFLIRATLAVLILAVLNVFLLHKLSIHDDVALSQRSAWYDLAGQFHETLAYIGKWNSVVKENEALKDQLQHQEVLEASASSLQTQNDFLKASLKLAPQIGSEPIPAGIYSISLAPNGYSALVNRGSKDGVSVGDIVVSSTGVLIGKIQAVSSDSSHVLLVADPSLTATVKVNGGQTSGIARGALAQGMQMELVTQSDAISEGDQIVTTGDDNLPPGLIIGTVSHVEDSSGQIFKKVSIKPDADFDDGSVLILHQ